MKISYRSEFEYNLKYELNTSQEGIKIIQEGVRCNLVQKGDLYYLQNNRGLFHPAMDNEHLFDLWLEINHN